MFRDFFRGSSEHNPNVSGKDSTSSVMSTGSEDGSTSGSDGSDIDGDIEVIDPDNVRTKDSGLSVVSLKVGMSEVKLCLHVPPLCPSQLPSKFIIVPW